MIPILIVGGSKTERDTQLSEYLENKRILEKLDGAGEAVKLDAVRRLLGHLSLKFNQEDRVALVITEAQALTHVAQNALLKSLEELPETVSFFLTADRETSLLPTVTSRCRLIKLRTEEVPLEKADEAEMAGIFKLVAASDIGGLLEKAGEWAKSGETGRKLALLTHFLLKHSRANPHPRRAAAIKLVLECASDLGHNISAQLTLEHLFIELVALAESAPLR